MVVIWGLDLKEMQWAKFKSSYMWNNLYFQRRRRFGVYQLAMILCVVSESLGTDALSSKPKFFNIYIPFSPNRVQRCCQIPIDHYVTNTVADYTDQQAHVEQDSGKLVSIRNNDIVGSFSYNIFVGVYVATIFGAAFFFDLFWPERKEIPSVQLAWKICSVLTVCFALSSAILLTVVLTTHRAALTDALLGDDIKLSPPLLYKKNGEAIASLVLIWLGWLATIWR
jgi:hypothetical protein